jgi:hypothetical protein
VPGPPPLRSFGLILHRDGSWTHEGVPIRNRKLRALFDRSVRYLPDEHKYVVQVGPFRGQVDPEETGFFVTAVSLGDGRVRLSDRSEEALDVDGLVLSDHDGALVSHVKRDLLPAGLPARWTHAAQAELLDAVEERAGDLVLRVAGADVSLPASFGAAG